MITLTILRRMSFLAAFVVGLACSSSGSVRDRDAGTGTGNDGGSRDGGGQDGGTFDDGGRADGGIDATDGGIDATASNATDSGADGLTVLRFDVNECKRSASAPELYTGRLRSEYVGLQCVAWKVSEGRALIDLINFVEGCGFQGYEADTLWSGAAERLGPGSVRLRVYWNFSDPSACGECLHDFSFEVEDVDSTGALEVEIQTRSCLDCAPTTTSATFEQSEGILCRYGVPGGFAELPKGTLHARPRSGGDCDPGLTAISIDTSQQLCAQQCSSTTACAVEEIFECRDGACQLSDPW